MIPRGFEREAERQAIAAAKPAPRPLEVEEIAATEVVVQTTGEIHTLTILAEDQCKYRKTGDIEVVFAKTSERLLFRSAQIVWHSRRPITLCRPVKPFTPDPTPDTAAHA